MTSCPWDLFLSNVIFLRSQFKPHCAAQTPLELVIASEKTILFLRKHPHTLELGSEVKHRNELAHEREVVNHFCDQTKEISEFWCVDKLKNLRTHKIV